MPLVTQRLESITVTNVELDVPGLGRAKGLCYDGLTCQYLGIPFATIPGRFRRPKPAPMPWPARVLDASKYGYELLQLVFTFSQASKVSM